jgi:hypothetical protein
MLFYINIFKLVYYKILSHSKLNYSIDFKLYLRLFYFKLIYIIPNYTLSYYILFYPKYNNLK